MNIKFSDSNILINKCFQLNSMENSALDSWTGWEIQLLLQYQHCEMVKKVFRGKFHFSQISYNTKEKHHLSLAQLYRFVL